MAQHSFGSLVIGAGGTGFFFVTDVAFRPNQCSGQHQSQALAGSGNETAAYSWVASETEEGSVVIAENNVSTAVGASVQMIESESNGPGFIRGTFQGFTDDGFQIHISDNSLPDPFQINFMAVRS